LLNNRKRLEEIEVKCYAYQIFKTLKYFKNKRVIHRDLKLGNLFLDDNMMIKVGDFGLAVKLDCKNERRKSVCGTPNYIAPEVIIDHGKKGHSYEVDLWALGIIIYTLLFGKCPFEQNEVAETYQKIKKVEYSFPNHIPISEEARDLISRILVSEPDKRITLAEMESHPFFDTTKIPKLLPVSCLNEPPSQEFYQLEFKHSKSNG
jgi:polo-like kinase 1